MVVAASSRTFCAAACLAFSSAIMSSSACILARSASHFRKYYQPAPRARILLRSNFAHLFQHVLIVRFMASLDCARPAFVAFDLPHAICGLPPRSHLLLDLGGSLAKRLRLLLKQRPALLPILRLFVELQAGKSVVSSRRVGNDSVESRALSSSFCAFEALRAVLSARTDRLWPCPDGRTRSAFPSGSFYDQPLCQA